MLDQSYTEQSIYGVRPKHQLLTETEKQSGIKRNIFFFMRYTQKKQMIHQSPQRKQGIQQACVERKEKEIIKSSHENNQKTRKQ